MSLLVVGSVAFDTIETPFTTAEKCIGGSASFISLAAGFFVKPVQLVGVVGDDFPTSAIEDFKSRGIDTTGLEIVKGEKTFHWHGKYHYDMNTRDTIRTDLNVFANFDPKIPAAYAKSEYVCLGNIDPTLQRRVLEQIAKPKLVACDTMNYWIADFKESLMKTLSMVDALIINDTEARQLTQEASLIKAGRKILSYGPSIAVIKKGEHGALLFTASGIFAAPAYPLEDVYDPTGAGDTFAGGFIGWLAKTDDISEANLRRAVIYGSVLASFSVEQFGFARLLTLTEKEVMERYLDFRNLAAFDELDY